MAHSIDELKSVVNKRGGFAKPNRYEIMLSLPYQVSPRVKGFSVKEVSLLCTSVILPGRNISTQDYNNGTQMKKIPYTYIDSDVTMTFNLTNDYFVKNVFDGWMENIIDTKVFSSYYKEEYTSDIWIHQLDENNNTIYTIKLINAFPINVADIALGNGEENAVGQVTVSFAYDRYESFEGRITNRPPIPINVPNVMSGSIFNSPLLNFASRYGVGFNNALGNPVNSLSSSFLAPIGTLAQGLNSFNALRYNVGALRSTVGGVRNRVGALSFSSIDSAIGSLDIISSGVGAATNQFGDVTSGVNRLGLF